MRMPEKAPTIDEMVETSGDMLFDPKVQALAKQYNDRYLHWDELRYRDLDGLDPTDVWMLMKVIRENSMKVVDFSGLRIGYNITNDFQRMLHEIDTCLSTGFRPMDGMEGNRRLLYSISSIMEESIASSQIEGASTTTKAAKSMLRNDRAPSNRSERMILNNYRAMQFIKAASDQPLSPDLILRIHGIISDGTLEDPSYEGRFRDDNSIVVGDISGNTYHQPVDFNRIGPMIDSLCEYINDDLEFVHPIVKGIILHFTMAYIHPFIDGNGRVSRSLFYWYGIKKGYTMMEYLAISKVIKKHKGRYDMAYLLSETDGNDMTYFIRYNLEIILEATSIFTGYLERKMREEKENLERLRDRDLSSRQAAILSGMMKSGEPVTAYAISSEYGISPQTARRDLIRLMDLGLVVESNRDGHRTTYMYSGKL